MMRAATIAALSILLLPGWTAAADVNEVFTKGEAKWADLTTDTSSGAVAAAGMLGIAGEAISTVENLKGLVTSLSGLNANGSKGTLAIGITPARTSFAPMNLSTYAGHGSMNATVARILGSTGIGYAQGQSTVGSQNFDRRAVSLQTGWYLHDVDDPVLAVALGLKSRCPDLLPPVKPIGPASPSSVVESSEGPPTKPAVVDGAEYKKRFADCTMPIIDGLRWNRSIAALSVSRGWIRRSDGSMSEMSMGTAWTGNLTIGFDPKLGWFDQGLALTLGYRGTRNEPVLTTLSNASPQRRNTSLTVLRLTGGSDKARLLLEGSNARANALTESQRNFKHAVGLDMRLAPEVWLNLRVGRHHALTGDKQETSSLLSVSWSPKALMDVGFGK